MVKERSDGAPQLNLRVPAEHQDRVRKVVGLLRTSEAFAARLDELIATASEPITPSFQAEITARVERLEAALLARPEPVKPTTASIARKPSKPPATKKSSASGDSASSQKRMTDEQRAKVRHLIDTTEMSNPAIGREVGISKEMVRRIRIGRAADSSDSIAP